MRWPKEVIIKEVGPRDGLQNESMLLDTSRKVTWINMLSQTGIKEIEYSSFVHPKWIPQLRDAIDVGKKIDRQNGVKYSALVPNERGLENALEAGIDGASVFMSASESHNKQNINKSIDETFPVLEPVIVQAKREKKEATGYISTVFECPFEGKIDIDQVLKVADKLFEYGVDYVSLGDTIGTAVPQDVERLLDEILYRYPAKNIIMHFHDTTGMGMANILTAIQYGIVRFDASLGGLGGCPYAPGAAGNVSTNDLVYMLNKQNIETGIDEAALFEATQYISRKLEKELPSRSYSYMLNSLSDEDKQSRLRKREVLYLFLKKQYELIRNISS